MFSTTLLFSRNYTSKCVTAGRMRVTVCNIRANRMYIGLNGKRASACRNGVLPCFAAGLYVFGGAAVIKPIGKVSVKELVSD
ncbi:hypothetical protein AALD01_09425 [Oscillospiraceae bacterium 21-37]